MATVKERITPSGTPLVRSIEPTPPRRIRHHKDYTDDQVVNPRNPQGITSVTVIVTKIDGTATSDTYTAAELSEYRDERFSPHTLIDKRTITIEALEWFQWAK